MPVPGLISIKSSHSARETMDRLMSAVTAKGLAVFARIDHGGGAAAAGLQLRPTEVLIFGNANGGTPLMQAVQTIGIDLPLKALVCEDEARNVWLAYNDPAWLATRHAINGADAVIAKLSAVLADVSKTATA